MLEITSQKRIIAFKATSNKPISESFLQNKNVLSKDVFVNSNTVKKPSLLSFLGTKIQENETLQRFKKHIKFLEGFESIITLFDAREETGTDNPRRTPEKRKQVLDKLEQLADDYYDDPKLKKMIKKLNSKEEFAKLNGYDKEMVKEWASRIYAPAERLYKHPIELSAKEEKLIENAGKIYAKAKTNNDYEMYKPALKAILKSNIDNAKCYSLKPYDYALNQQIKGASTKELDRVFSDLKDKIVPMVEEIKVAKAKKPEQYNFSFLNEKVEASKMVELAKEVITEMGFDFSKGKLLKSVHPVTIPVCAPTDIIITVQNTEKEITFGEALEILSSAMHEAGHAIVEQGADMELRKTGLIAPDLAVDESQSRLWEVMVGKSKPFLKYVYPKLKEVFPEALKDVSFEEFYKASNNVEATPIRTAADELTYNLHIMLRYELEKELFKSDIKDLGNIVNKLPEMWNDKTKKYLGITPKNNKEGILQDIHYSDGSFGYFPSYTLGNLLSAQIMNSAKKQIPDLEQQIEKGNFKPLRDFLTKNIYKNGSRGTYNEIAKKVTGKELSSDAFISHLKTKFSEIYDLKN